MFKKSQRSWDFERTTFIGGRITTFSNVILKKVNIRGKRNNYAANYD